MLIVASLTHFFQIKLCIQLFHIQFWLACYPSCWISSFSKLSALKYQYFLKTRCLFTIFIEGQSQAWKPFRVLWAWVSRAVCSQASNELQKSDLIIISVKNCFHFTDKMMHLSELSEAIRHVIGALSWSIWEKNLKKWIYVYV